MNDLKKPARTLADLDALRLKRAPVVLVIEDDPKVSRFLAELLGSSRPATPERPAIQAWSVTTAASLAEAHAAIATQLYDLQIVDRNLPDGDGIDFVAWQREAGVRTPIIMLTQLSDLKHRLQGWARFVDQYIGKPFDADELLAIIAATTWRRNHEGLLVRGKLEINFNGRGAASYAGIDLPLVRDHKLRVLAFIAMHDPEPVTREMLLEHVWRRTRDPGTGELNDPGTNSVAVTLSRLRADLAADGVSPEIIATVDGGWKLDAALLQRGPTPA